MGLLDLIAAYAVAQGSHTGGHFDTANKQGVPMSLSGTQEVWNQTDKRKDVDINGAGFSMQDKVINSWNSKEQALMNAAIKVGYILGAPGMLNKDLKGYGDINNMERLSGNPKVKEMIAATAVSDIMKYKNPKQPWSVNFSTFGTGQPGLLFNYRW